ARGDGFLWERVVEMMGSSGSSGGVVRNRDEVLQVGEKTGINSECLNVGEEDRS
nr:hypothetical protein [Tanacetum cinerariifolium]